MIDKTSEIALIILLKVVVWFFVKNRLSVIQPKALFLLEGKDSQMILKIRIQYCLRREQMSVYLF